MEDRNQESAAWRKKKHLIETRAGNVGSHEVPSGPTKDKILTEVCTLGGEMQGPNFALL